jgi:ATP-binding cassette subfamily C protein CydC
MYRDGGRQLVLGLLLAITATLSGIALLGLSGWFITATALAGLSMATALAFDVFAPSAGIRLLALSRTAARYGERLATHEATLGVLAALRERLFRGWSTRPAARALLMRPGKFLFRLTQDVDALEPVYLRVMVPVVAIVCVAFATGVVFGLMHPLLGIAVGLFLAVTGVGVPLLGVPFAIRMSHRRAHAIERLRGRTIDLVSGQTDLAMAGRLGAQRDAIAQADRRLAEADVALNKIDSWLTLGFGTVSALLLSGVLLAVAALVERGDIGAPVAALGVLVALGAMEPFSALRRGALDLGRTLLAARRVRSLLAPSVAKPPAEIPRDGFAVVCTDAMVKYAHASRSTLSQLNLAIRQGERVALIGPSGSGKSTLMALLAGDLDAGTGSAARIRGTLFTQRTELFQDTLRDNIRLANRNADDARILQALEVAGLSSYLQALPDGLDTRLGEGGLGLSGGEARRLALARLLLHDTQMWLLDEPTEGLDGATARDVLERLAAHAGSRALIIATHVRREAKLADRVLVLQDGRVVADVTRNDENFETVLGKLRPD